MPSRSNTSLEDCLAEIEPQLRIRVIHLDEDIIVIDKPCNLRSVPGHLHPRPSSSEEHPRPSQKRPHAATQEAAALTSSSNAARMTAQQAWEAAIRSFSSPSTDNSAEKKRKAVSSNREEANTNNTLDITSYLKQLSAADSLVASIPRKWKLFHRYIARNQKRILLMAHNDNGDTTRTKQEQEALQTIAKQMHEEIRIKQQRLINVPESTRDEDSAYGQLRILLGHTAVATTAADKPHTKLGGRATINLAVQETTSIYIVHRLDCETSGVMVFARHQAAASALCRAWRERDDVSKTYLAKVGHWPLYHRKDSISKGRIEISLAPSDERLKWKVVPVSDIKGKSSITEWRVLEDKSVVDDLHTCSEGDGDKTEQRQHAVILELKPITGRTHQLRIHCAHVGSGILGDSLYGENQLESLGWTGQHLMLHANKLSFVHPATNEKCEFISWPEWYNEGTTSSSNS